MRKFLLTAAIAASAITAVNVQSARAWDINCANDNCSSSEGSVKLFYRAYGNYSFNAKVKLTSVQGLPFSMEDFQSQEKKVDMSIEQSITKDTKSGAGLDASGSAGEGATGGGKLSSDSSTTTGLTNKRNIGMSNTAGGKINIDHMMAFFKDYGSNHPVCSKRPAETLNRYTCTADAIMADYQRGGENVRDEMYGYLYGRKAAGIMPMVNVAEKLTPANSEMQTIKYAALTHFPSMGEKRWVRAYSYTSEQAQDDKLREQFNKNLTEDKLILGEMLKPGITALKLEKQGNHTAALAKWVVDADKIGFVESPELFKGISSLQDKYLAAIGFVKYAPKTLKDSFEADYAKARSVNNPTLSIVTVKGSAGGIAGKVALIVAVWAALVGVGYKFRAQIKSFFQKMIKKAPKDV